MFMFENCAVYEGAQTLYWVHENKTTFESCAVYEGAQTGYTKLITIYVFENCAIYMGTSIAHAYCWLDYQVLTRPPLILSPSLSVNYSDIPMFDASGGLRETLNHPDMSLLGRNV